MSQVEKLFCSLDHNARLYVSWASQVVLPKNLPTRAGDVRDMGLIPGLERSPGGG